MKHLLTILCVAAPVFIAGAQNVDLGSDAQREAGRVLYAEKCSQCHGADGAGDGPATAMLRPTPRDFTSSTFKFRTTESGELPTDEDIKRSIRNGMPGTAMPPWPSLNESEVTNLMFYLKTFADDFSGPYGEVTPIEIPKPMSATPESIARGAEVYLENQCSDCHGLAGRGDGTSSATLKDQWDYPIRPADLTKRWNFRGGDTPRDIYRTFMTGLDGSPMPSYDVQPPEDQWALVNYVYSLSSDEPDYGTVIVAAPTAAGAPLDASLFDASEPAFFPVVGQIVQPGRAFFPGVNAIEVQAAYGDDHVSLMLTWHDMQADLDGSNAPDLPVASDTDTTGTFSDAVAVQFPSVQPAGTERPYFLFGDRKNATDLWFVDLSGPAASHWVGRGAASLSAEGPELTADASFADGAWTVMLRRDRESADHIAFDVDAFVPVAFSVWDGTNHERGSRRGITSWYNVYLEPADRPSPVGPMMLYGLITLLLGIGTTVIMRRKYGEGG